MKNNLIFRLSVAFILVLAIIILPFLLSLLGFVFWGLMTSVPLYNEAVYIGVDFGKETEFNLLLPVISNNKKLSYCI